MRSSTSRTNSVLLFSTLLIVAVFGLSELHPEQDQLQLKQPGQMGFDSFSIRENDSGGLIDQQMPVDVDQILELREQVNRPLTGSFLNGGDSHAEFAVALEQVSGQSIINQDDPLEKKGMDLPKPDSVSASELVNKSASLLEQAAGRVQSKDPEFALALRNLARKIRKKAKNTTLAN